MIRVLLAEDSPTARALIASILTADADIRLVGEAKNGVEAVEMTRRLKPDLVIMDIHMPLLDGFEATKQIMIEAPTPIVVVSSSVDAHGAVSSIQALRAGALSIMSKPPGPTSPAFEESARSLISAVKTMSQVKVVRHFAPRVSTRSAVVAPRRGKIVAIAASTGGPAAMNRILAELPASFPAPILLVQHIADGFLGAFTDWLNGVSSLMVKIAEDGELLVPGKVYVAAEKQHLGVTPLGKAVLSDAPPIGGFRPSASFLFQSVAASYGAESVAAILTGMGSDGVDGLRAIKTAGGRIIAQDEETSVVFGMPGAAVSAGLPDVVLPLPALAAALREMTA